MLNYNGRMIEIVIANTLVVIILNILLHLIKYKFLNVICL